MRHSKLITTIALAFTFCLLFIQNDERTGADSTFLATVTIETRTSPSFEISRFQYGDEPEVIIPTLQHTRGVRETLG